MTDLSTKLTKAILTTKSNATTAARIFLGRLVANYGILFKLPSDNSPQLVSRFFVAVCGLPRMNTIGTI